MIEANRLTRRYGDFLAVSEVSFAIEQGEIVGLLGHNGAGKTTIMKMLTGYLEPSGGQVLVDALSALSEIDHSFFFSPCFLICLGIRCCLAISTFSSSV